MTSDTQDLGHREGRLPGCLRRLLRRKARGCSSCCEECAQLCRRRRHARGERTTLDSLRVGEKGLVVSVAHGDEELLSRLADRGLVKGAGVTVRQQALFGGPILISVQGAMMALRRTEAALIEITCL